MRQRMKVQQALMEGVHAMAAIQPVLRKPSVGQLDPEEACQACAHA